MLSYAWQSIKAWPGRLAGTFVALALGIALIAAAGLVMSAGPDRPDQASAYEEATSLLGLMAGISGFASIFVIAGTFALSIQQRRRELALLRVVGATPRQLRRMLLFEAQLVGLAAVVAGWAMALPVAQACVGLLRSLHVGPETMTISFYLVPVVLAACLGLLVALAGVWFAARRARRIRPTEALRQAAVEQRPMTVSRWVIGVLAIAGGVAMLGTMAGTGSESRTSIALLVGEILVIGATALAPVVVPPLVWSAAALLRRHATVEVAQANLRAQARRTASVAAPVLLVIGIAGSLLAATSSLERSAANEERARTVAPIVLVPSGASGLPGALGLPAAIVEAASTVDGVASVSPIGNTHVYAPGEYSTHVIPEVAISSGAVRFDVRDGDMGALRADAFAASHAFAADHGWRVGDTIRMRLDDGSEAALRLVATVDGGIAGGSLFVPADRLRAHMKPDSITHALVTLKPGADPASVRKALTGNGFEAIEREEWFARVERAQAEGLRIGLTAILAMAGLYAAIAIVNTLIMAVRERAQDLALMRLAGATPRQALRTLMWEGGLIAAIGLALGGTVTAITMMAMRVALQTISVTAQASLPWSVMTGLAAGCTLVILLTCLVSGAIALRRSPLATLAIPE